MTTSDRATVVGVFTERGLADRALEELHNAGFTDDEIGFIAPHRHSGGVLFRDNPEDEAVSPNVGMAAPVIGAPGTGVGAPYGSGMGAPIAAAPLIAGETDPDMLTDDDDTAANATTGAVGGGVLGGIIGAAAALLIPGFGPVLAGGILAATLGGAAIGALTGGLVGALTHLGVPETEANYYQDELNAGKTVVTVHAPNRYEEALAILKASGATDASGRYTSDAAAPVYNETGTVAPAAPVYSDPDAVTPTSPVYNNTNPVNPAAPVYNDQPGTVAPANRADQGVETVVPGTNQAAPTAPTNVNYADEPTVELQKPARNPFETLEATTNTSTAVNATTPDTTGSPQAAYTPNPQAAETTREAEMRQSQATYDAQGVQPDERS